METVKKILSKSVVWIFFALFLGVVIGRWIIPVDEPEEHEMEMAEVEEWTCSMHPQIRQNEQGNCPICGMELIPVGDLGSSPIVLEMTEEAIMLGGIETTPVTLSSPEKEIYLQGKVKPDESRISLVTSRFPGRIEKLYVDFTGMEVLKGQKLASIYSPELVTAQQELFEAIKYKDTNPPLYTAARNKLRYWNITEVQIDEIESGGTPKTVLDVLAPLNGVVTQRHATLGEYVKEGTPLFELVDLNRVWLLFDGYESDLPWLKLGDEIEYSISSLPGKSFKGKINFIDPVVNPVTRSVSIRLETSNRGRLLKPEMFANGIVKARLPLKEPKVVIPKASVLWTGKRAIVYVKVEGTHQPSFQFKEIILGPDLGTHFVVESGLKEGEILVSNGTFKVDAASQLAGKTSMMNDPESVDFHGEIHVPLAFRQQLTLLFNSYFELKDAFVSSDPNVTSGKAEESRSQLSKVEMHLLEDKNTHDTWMKLHKKISTSLEEISKLEDIEAQRKSFITLSDAISNTIEIFGVHGITVYKDYCPMADGNKGAIWLSQMEEIQNPYFGQKMLKCGEVKKVYDGKPNTTSTAPMQGHNH